MLLVEQPGRQQHRSRSSASGLMRRPFARFTALSSISLDHSRWRSN